MSEPMPRTRINAQIRAATYTDFPDIVLLMNDAYRGAVRKRGWTTEADYIAGVRTSESLVQEEIADGALYLITKDEVTAALRGCVSVREVSPRKWYLGSLTVDPAFQASGLGNELLSAAEAYAVSRDAQTVEMTVISFRDTLISWYERRGYRLTGETRPFPYEEKRVGTPIRPDLSFSVLEKQLVWRYYS